MKKDVLISIKGIQTQDGEEDVVELLTTGSFYRRGENYYIAYDESEATGFEGARTTVKLEEQDARVTMKRSGSISSQLIIESGIRHQCNYDTGYGNIIIGVLGDHIRTTLTDEGGKLEFGYSLDVNASLASEHTVAIEVRSENNRATAPINPKGKEQLTDEQYN